MTAHMASYPNIIFTFTLFVVSVRPSLSQYEKHKYNYRISYMRKNKVVPENLLN